MDYPDNLLLRLHHRLLLPPRNPPSYPPLLESQTSPRNHQRLALQSRRRRRNILQEAPRHNLPPSNLLRKRGCYRSLRRLPCPTLRPSLLLPLRLRLHLQSNLHTPYSTRRLLLRCYRGWINILHLARASFLQPCETQDRACPWSLSLARIPSLASNGHRPSAPRCSFLAWLDKLPLDFHLERSLRLFPLWHLLDRYLCLCIRIYHR